MNSNLGIAKHYSRGELLSRLRAALQDDGADPDHPTMDALAPYDQFHGRGVEATRDALELMPACASDSILDIGSGLGGPARSVADRFGCTVTGIDLMPEFCEVARHLSRLLDFDKRTVFEVADATSMPFEAGSFDGAYSMNVSMNIPAKAAFYGEVHRVLKPGAWLVLSEIARGKGPDVDYPTAWAASSESSFLCTPDETVLGLKAAGFEVISVQSTLEEMLAFGARSRELVQRGEKPPHRAVMLVHAENAAAAMKNTSRGFAEGRILPIELVARRRSRP
ncbi:MAG TPA: class I SAM-dependent methyltransferase [Ramlibacter sp.]|nr:class I SAM-dependent methyltransferase [Ramlibacter sp.]